MLPTDDSALPLADRVRAVADEVAASREAFVTGVEVKGRSGQHIVEIFADTDAGIGVDDLAQLSREIGFALDEVMPDKYLLNISSPGASKPLVLPRQFARHIGRRLRIDVRAAAFPPDEVVEAEAGQPSGQPSGTAPTPGATTRRAEGLLDAVTASTLTLVPDPADALVKAAVVKKAPGKGGRSKSAPPPPSPDAISAPLTVAFDDLIEARVLLPW